MQATLIVTLVLHVLSGVFWAGSTFVLARTGGHQADQFFRQQMGAATLAVLTGALLWFLLHRGPAGIAEHILGVGAVCALLAAGVQGASARALRLAAAGEVPGFPHLSTGQEAVAVGVCEHLTPQDTLFTGHRGHGHVLVKGSDVEATFAEIIGRETGLCRGRGGTMHLVDAANGVLGATGVVGGNLSLAAGAAWTAQAAGSARRTSARRDLETGRRLLRGLRALSSKYAMASSTIL